MPRVALRYIADEFPEKINACKRGFTSLESEGDVALCINKSLADQGSHGITVHFSIIAHFPVIGYIRIKAVMASHIARTRHRLDHHTHWGHTISSFTESHDCIILLVVLKSFVESE